MTKNAAVPLFLLLAVLALGAAPVAAAQPVAADSSRLQADTFVEKARAALAAGSLAESEDLLSSALQLSPDYSEALYLRARLELPDQHRTLAAVAMIFARPLQAPLGQSRTRPPPTRRLPRSFFALATLREALATLLSALAGRASSTPERTSCLQRCTTGKETPVRCGGSSQTRFAGSRSRTVLHFFPRTCCRGRETARLPGR